MTGLLQRNNNDDVAETRREEARGKRDKHERHEDHDGAGAETKGPHRLNGHGKGLNGGTGHDASSVLQTLESEIIPRLILSCRNGKPDLQPEAPVITPENDFESAPVTEFANLLIAEDSGAVSAYLADLRANGASLEWLYMELMGPAARRLGYLWEEDHCSIIDVTLGVGRLQQVLRELSPEFQQYRGLPDIRRRALLLPVPGEQHTFGLSVLMDFFRRAGWDLWGWPLLEDDDLINLVRNEWFGVIGLSVSAQVNLTGLSTLIRDLRSVSGNPDIGVMVGGPVFTKNPQLSQEVGADATAADAQQAVRQAEDLLNLQ
jgi:methanogenic corrinoid protein MtbC1